MRTHLRVLKGGRQLLKKAWYLIFELSPADWRLLFLHAGWKIQQERLYLQYPKHGLLRLTKPLWRNLDFEGFWGAVLQRDSTWSGLYQGEE